jgi:hypothetical protein
MCFHDRRLDPHFAQRPVQKRAPRWHGSAGVPPDPAQDEILDGREERFGGNRPAQGLLLL